MVWSGCFLVMVGWLVERGRLIVGALVFGTLFGARFLGAGGGW